jgi:hypothetical protein
MPDAVIVIVGGPDGAGAGAGGAGAVIGGVGDVGVDVDAPLEQAAIVSVTMRKGAVRNTASASTPGRNRTRVSLF